MAEPAPVPAAEPEPGRGSDESSAPGGEPSLLLLRRIRRATVHFKRAAKVHGEVADALAVLEQIASDLVAGRGPHGEPLDYRQLAALVELVPDSLDRLGYADLDRELRHVGETLTTLAGSAPLPVAVAAEEPREEGRKTRSRGQRPATIVTSSARAATAGRGHGTARVSKVLGPPGAVRQARLGILGVALAAVAAVLVLTLADRPRRDFREARESTVVEPVLAVATPTATVTARQAPAAPTPDPRLRDLPDLISQSRVALQRGDTALAVSQLSAAALIDHDHSLVLETSRLIVDALLELAARAVAEERWRDAEDALVQARGLALRFSADATVVERRLQELYQSEWIYRVRPDQLDELRVLVGVEVVVRSRDGRTVAGVLREVGPRSLILEGRGGVGGGQVQFTTSVDLAAIAEVTYSIRPTPR